MKSMLLVAVVGLAACETTTQVDTTAQVSAIQLATQSDMSAITGKTLTFAMDQSFVISDDGTLKGSWNGEPLIGTYEMKDGFFCRTLSAGPRGPSPEDCQLFKLNGTSVSATRDRGNGGSFTYTVS